MTETPEAPETEFFYHSVQVGDGRIRYESIDRDSAVTHAQNIYRDEGVIPELFEVPYMPNWKRGDYKTRRRSNDKR